MNEVDETVREVPRKVRTKVLASVTPQLSRHEHLGMTVGDGQLDIRIRLVITQQDVIARLLLLDEVVLEGQRLALVGNDDIVHIHRIANERAGLRVLLRRTQKVAANARTQALRLADI